MKTFLFLKVGTYNLTNKENNITKYGIAFCRFSEIKINGDILAT